MLKKPGILHSAGGETLAKGWKWHVRTTISPVYAGTSEPLPSQLPKGIKKRMTSALHSMTRWSFMTLSSAETWMMDRIPMLQHQETMPRTRVTLFLEEKGNETNVWEMAERVPPSTARELGPSSTGDPRDSASASRSPQEAARREQYLPGLVMEVSADGQEVVSWPGPETTPG